MLTLRAAFWLIVSAAAVRTFGGQRVAERWLRVAASTRRDDARARQLARAVHRAARVLRPRPACLSRALAGAKLLASESLDARVTLGVARGSYAHELAAHAWLTHGSLVLSGEDTDRDYRPFCAIDTAARPAFVTLS